MPALMKRLLTLIMVFFVAVANSGCALSLKQEIRTESATETEIAGAYSLVLYGARHGNDLESVAILAKDDAPYTIVPYAPAFDYRIMKHLDAKDALARGKAFVSFHPAFSQAQLARIADSSGRVIGYEIRPIYHAFTFGISDVLDIFYWRSDDKVFVKMRLKEEVENKIMGGAGVHDHR